MNFTDYPAPAPVALDVALRWTASADWCYEAKLDGKRARLAAGVLQGRAMRYPLPGTLPSALASYVFDGELCGKTYYVFDVLEADGQDLRGQPLHARKAALLALQPHLPGWIQPIPSAPPGTAGGDYLRTVLQAGHEGIVAKDLGAPYGRRWFKAKARPTFDAVVVSKSPHKLSVAVAQYSSGQLVPCGNVAVPSRWHFGRVRAGSVLELSAQGRTRTGAFREPAFLRLRNDKPETACTI